jgi:hypothetical protein
MDIKSSVAKLAADADMRNRFIRQVPDAFNDYFVTATGELATRKELEINGLIRYFKDGLDLVTGQLSKI